MGTSERTWNCGVYYADCRAVFFLSAAFSLISGGNEGKHNGDNYT